MPRLSLVNHISIVIDHMAHNRFDINLTDPNKSAIAIRHHRQVLLESDAVCKDDYLDKLLIGANRISGLQSTASTCLNHAHEDRISTLLRASASERVTK
jgi:hypothetical protein